MESQYRSGNDENLVERLGQYRFYHTIDLGNGAKTAGIKKLVPQQQMFMRQLRRLNLKGKRVLDIGCRDGLFSFEAENLGAAEVIGIDNCLSRGAVEVLIPHLKSAVKMYEMNLLHMTPDTLGTFDVILFAGVLYHLRYPFQALRLIRDLLNDHGVLLLETALLRAWESAPLLYCPAGKESPYESSSVTFFNAHGVISTSSSLGLDAEFIDHLFGPKIFSTPGATFRSYVGMLFNTLQRVMPWAVHTMSRTFFIDRGVFRCTRRAGVPPAEFEYWDASHRVHQ